jgi:oxaloacetate decarboxylase alpha subunit/acetyl-CoA carboxylase biotin carboxyl carrier protein
MEGNHFDYPLDMQEIDASVISIEQLQRLVRLLDESDVTELELERAAEGIHLALRKVRADESGQVNIGQIAQAATALTDVMGANADANDVEKTTRNVVAPLVGTFHVWAKPRGGALVAVGDKVKVGQLVGTIQSLNVLNDVETSVAGRVVELLVQDGQPVEYGQVLMTIDSANETKGA